MATNRTVITNANNVVSVNDELTQAMATVERLKAEAAAKLAEANAIVEKNAKAFAERKSAAKTAATEAIRAFKKDASDVEFKAFLVEFLKELPKATKGESNGTRTRTAKPCQKQDASGNACGLLKHTKNQVCKGVAVAA